MFPEILHYAATAHVAALRSQADRFRVVSWLESRGHRDTAGDGDVIALTPESSLTAAVASDRIRQAA